VFFGFCPPAADVCVCWWGLSLSTLSRYAGRIHTLLFSLFSGRVTEAPFFATHLPPEANTFFFQYRLGKTRASPRCRIFFVETNPSLPYSTLNFLYLGPPWVFFAVALLTPRGLVPPSIFSAPRMRRFFFFAGSCGQVVSRGSFAFGRLGFRWGVFNPPSGRSPRPPPSTGGGNDPFLL